MLHTYFTEERRSGVEWRQRGHVRTGALDVNMAVYVVSQVGGTALITASRMGHLEVVQALLAAGADKDAMSYARVNYKYHIP